EKQLTEKESLDLIATMINKAKDSYYDTGVGAIMWGAVIAVCSLIRLSEIHFQYKLPFDVYLLTLVAVIPQVIISIREKKARKVKAYDDIFLDYLWLGFGICIFLMIFIVNTMFGDLRPLLGEYRELTKNSAIKFEFHYHEFIAPLFLLLYGFPTFVTGAAFKFRPMLWGGIFCWVCCLITLFTTIKIDLLLTAASAVFAWLIPGIMMEKEYRLYKREQAGTNV
ncbi:MAG: hypothetical protein H7Y42_10185, partial [Chitinophagaceae bacterium]|nr:hypothetical protein [Chitinophagaceae bacterium]